MTEVQTIVAGIVCFAALLFVIEQTFLVKRKKQHPHR